MITSPTLLLDEKKCRKNIQRMALKARRNGLSFKPHFKTHQSAAVGEWFREEGVEAITVSSVTMAQYFANSGWQDITIAFPVNIREIKAINDLAATLDTLSLFVYNASALHHLKQHLKYQIKVYIEIDTGANRSGLKPVQLEEIATQKSLIDESEKMTFVGFYSHPGHSYAARSREEIMEVHHDLLSKMDQLRQHYPKAKICMGDTPCCSVAEDFKGIDELSPGNFVFYDLMQRQITACTTEDIAVALAAPVTAKYPERGEIIVHGGAVHLSKETIEWRGKQIFGLPVTLHNDELKKGWAEPIPGAWVKAVSQEHGVVKCGQELLDETQIGDIVGILPIHSCLTANLMGSYYSLSDERLIK